MSTPDTALERLIRAAEAMPAALPEWDRFKFDARLERLELVEALRDVEKWWLEDGKLPFDGAPHCIFTVRDLLAKHGGNTMTRITEQDDQRRESYFAKAPKFLGDLHERMRLVRALAERDYEKLPSDLWHAICDLELEVSYHTPARPPYGRRTQKARNH